MNHANDCDCDKCAFPRARKPQASLERFTWRLALIWAAFRMIADIIGRSIYAIPVLIGHAINAVLGLTLELLRIAMAAMIVATFAAMLFWFWTMAGKPMPF